MEAQFIRIAGELGWDLDMQVAKLEEFIDVAGRHVACQEFLGPRKPQGLALRDALLRFVAGAGYSGAFTRFMLAQLPARSRTTAPEAAPDPAPVEPAPRRAGFLGWLRRRRSQTAAP